MRKQAFSLAFVFLCAFAVLGQTKAVSNTGNWISSPTLNLEKLRDLNTGELPPYSINGNRDCITQKIITRPAKIVPPQTEQHHEGCVVDTSFGAYSTSGYLQRQGTDVAGELRFTNTGGIVNLVPIPRSNTSLRLGASGANGVNLFFKLNYEAALQSSADSFGAVTHRTPSDYTSALKDRSGQLLYARPESIAFSGNSKWMLVDTSFIGTVRVNLETFEVLPFGPAYNYNIGLTPGMQSAISGDGRFAVLFSKSFGRFRIYDLSTCGVVPNFITGPASCQSRDLYGFMPGSAPQNVALSTMRFINNELLSMYINHQEGASTKTSRFVLGLPGASAFSMDYLALGDSYTSGEGAFEYKALTDTNDNKCHLSVKSYPYLLGTQLDLNKYESVACSGATTADILNPSEDYRGQVYDGLRKRERNNILNVLEAFYPGYLAQHEFITSEVRKHSPENITLSAIGNDIGFASKLANCLAPGTCFASYEDRLEIFREVNSKFAKLVDMYGYLQQASVPQTKIYVVGYPQIAATGGNCASNVHLNETEIAFSQSLITHLNNVIEQAAARAGVRYVDIEEALIGYRLCETQSWDVAVNGLTAGNDIVKLLGGPIGNESYHPTAFGQELIARKIHTETDGFKQNMPTPNPSASPPTENSNSILLQAPKNNRQVYKTVFDSDAQNDTVYLGQVASFSVSSAGKTLKPSSVFKAEIHSTPMSLGNFTSDSQGNIQVSAVVPENTVPGWHTLHIFGQNVADEAVDIYRTIYVAASKSDYNGNSLADDEDPCPSVTASGTDSDQDGIDDACDGYIAKPKLENAGSTGVSNILFSSTSPATTPTETPGQIAVAGLGAGVQERAEVAGTETKNKPDTNIHYNRALRENKWWLLALIPLFVLAIHRLRHHK